MPPTIPKGTNAGALADWTEVTLFTDAGRTLSHARIDRMLRGESSDLAEMELVEDRAIGHPEPDEADDGNVDLSELGEEGELERDVRIELLLEEMTLRAKLGSKVYPFRVESERVLQIEACGEAIYVLLLALGSSDASYRTEKRAHETEAAFDLIALEALRRFLGRGAQGVRFAKNSHDPDDEDTRPQLFSDAIRWLRAKLDLRGDEEPVDELEHRHWEWDAPDDPRPVLNSYNDGGVDVVVWWRFEDKRRGFPVLLAQCTVQLTWQDKLEDIPLVVWEKWIDFSMVPPQRALVIPFGEDPKDKLWEDRSLRAGVVIDRVRLLELLNELECEQLEELVDQDARQWAETELTTIE